MGRGKAAATLRLIEAAKEILREIQPASVRAVCYQCFIRGLIPSMEKGQTNRVGSLLTSAREEGEILCEHIVQEGRAIEKIHTWADPASFARAVQHSYRRNKWAGQPKRIIVVSEKGTVRGTLEPVLDEFEVDFLPVGGYASATRVKGGMTYLNIHTLANPAGEIRSQLEPVPASVPEPTTLLLWGSTVAGLALAHRKLRKQA